MDLTRPDMAKRQYIVDVLPGWKIRIGGALSREDESNANKARDNEEYGSTGMEEGQML